MFKIINEDLNIEKIADSGQCFRMDQISSGLWKLIAGEKWCTASEEECNGQSITTINCPEGDDDFWRYYFDLDTDYETFRNAVKEDDLFLNDAVEYGKGIRILRQDPWEMLITFIISQRKNIPAIKSCVEKLCRRWGKKLADDIYGFPTPEAMASASLSELSDCSLGYRAEYVYLAAKAVNEGSADLKALSRMNDEDLYKALLSFKGVGAKVANCVSLFGFYRIGAFPIDVWIDRVQKEYYNGRFPVEKYPGFAGIMQQYIFYYIRKKNESC